MTMLERLNPLTKRLLETNYSQMQEAVDSLSDEDRAMLGKTVRELEGLAEAVVRTVGYLDMRHNNGCRDMGHRAAVKRSNRNGRRVWVDIFGYNGTTDIDF